MGAFADMSLLFQLRKWNMHLSPAGAFGNENCSFVFFQVSEFKVISICIFSDGKI